MFSPVRLSRQFQQRTGPVEVTLLADLIGDGEGHIESLEARGGMRLCRPRSLEGSQQLAQLRSGNGGIWPSSQFPASWIGSSGLPHGGLDGDQVEDHGTDDAGTLRRQYRPDMSNPPIRQWLHKDNGQTYCEYST